jgi:hypothetical protein
MAGVGAPASVTGELTGDRPLGAADGPSVGLNAWLREAGENAWLSKLPLMMSIGDAIYLFPLPTGIVGNKSHG